MSPMFHYFLLIHVSLQVTAGMLSLEISHYWQTYVSVWWHSLLTEQITIPRFSYIFFYDNRHFIQLMQHNVCIHVAGLFTSANRCHSVNVSLREICQRDPEGEIWYSNQNFCWMTKNAHGNSLILLLLYFAQLESPQRYLILKYRCTCTLSVWARTPQAYPVQNGSYVGNSLTINWLSPVTSLSILLSLKKTF